MYEHRKLVKPAMRQKAAYARQWPADGIASELEDADILIIVAVPNVAGQDRAACVKFDRQRQKQKLKNNPTPRPTVGVRPVPLQPGPSPLRAALPAL
jgi:hypothetical protein